LTREERSQGVLAVLPYAQATVLALAIVRAKEIFGENMPSQLLEVVLEGEYEANRLLHNNKYARHFHKAIQENDWEV
jgi:hypothetical protein